MIDKITKEQEAMMAVYRDNWIAIGKDTNNLPESEIYFGDLKYAYWMGDRQKMTVKISQDTTQAFTQDQTAIRVVSRIAGTVVEARALKCLNTIP